MALVRFTIVGIIRLALFVAVRASFSSRSRP
jgi:hypothetical protein